MDYKDFNGQYFVFVGQKATTGKPHPITGRMSYFGFFLKADSKAQAIRFEESHDGRDASMIYVVGTARSLRKYKLGISVESYLEDLHFADDIKE